MKIKGIFFDLWGTLFKYGDLEKAMQDHETVIRSKFETLGMQVSEETFNNLIRDYFDYQVTNDIDKSLSLFECKLKRLAEKLEIQISNQDLHEIAMDSISAWEHHHLIDEESVKILQYFKQNKKIALISNFDHPPFIYDILNRFELNDYFDSINISAEFGENKPSPNIFLKSLDETKLSPNEVIFIGDSLIEDVKGALSVGMIPVQIDRENMEDISHLENSGFYILRELNKLPELVSLIESRVA